MADFFSSVIKVDPRYNFTGRIDTLALLEPHMRAKVEAILTDAHANGLSLMVFETYRSEDRQEMLFKQGATQLQHAGVHHWGLACDIVKVVNGHPSWDGDFSMLGHLARAHNLIWGGDWGRPNLSHSFIDAVHVQWCTVARQNALFAGTWYPTDDYNPYSEL